MPKSTIRVKEINLRKSMIIDLWNIYQEVNSTVYYCTRTNLKIIMERFRIHKSELNVI